MNDSERQRNAVGSRVVLKPGDVLRNTYTVDCHLGQGHFADVYLVRHRYMGMQAMKLFRNFGQHRDDHTAGFDEAFMLSKIAHPGIVRAFDANRLEKEHDNPVYMTMEYVAGGTLADLLREEDLTVSKSLAFGIQMADAVAHAHLNEPPIVHRDIKPQNVLVDRSSGECRIKLADFGLAKQVNRITETVVAGGTIIYRSPESLVGYEEPASDVFSLGLIVYQMLCSCLPYRLTEIPPNTTVDEAIAIIDQWQREEFHPPSYFKSNIPPEVDAVVLRALSHATEHRYRDARAFGEALQICQEINVANSNCQPVEDEESSIRAKKVIQLAFRVASTLGREGEASEWLSLAFKLDPRLANKYGAYMNLWSGSDPVSKQ